MIGVNRQPSRTASTYFNSLLVAEKTALPVPCDGL
jgi:hypothetical protein